MTASAPPRAIRDRWQQQRALTGAPAAAALLVTFRVEADSASDGSTRFDAVGDVVTSGRLSAALASGGLNVTTTPVLVSHVTVSAAPSGGLISALLSAAAASPVIAIACGGGGALVVLVAIIYWARRKRRMCWRSVIITERRAAVEKDFFAANVVRLQENPLRRASQGAAQPVGKQLDA